VAPTPRNRALDGLRGLAALSVLAFHGWMYSRAVPTAGARATVADTVLHELRIGLVLFFVLSGYLLYRPWAGRRPPALERYALARALRIVPAYLVALAGSVLLLWSIPHAPGVRLPPAEQLPLFLVFAQNLSEQTVMRLDPPMWTLAVEVSFYAVLPLLGALALRLWGGRALVPLALLAGGVAYNAWLARMEVVTQPLAKSLPAMAPYFALGMLAAVALARWRPGARARVALLAGGAALVLGDLVWQAALAADGRSDLWPRILRDAPAAAGFAAIVIAVASAGAVRDAAPAGWTARALGWRPLAAAGTVSYGLYLWHVPLLLWLRAHGLLPANAAGALLVVTPLALLAATASWRLVERPLLKAGGPALRRRRRPCPAPAAARARPASASSRSARRSPPG
jgi:peptidoglycan/LPS O-acetylase OafA/YrhL